MIKITIHGTQMENPPFLRQLTLLNNVPKLTCQGLQWTWRDQCWHYINHKIRRINDQDDTHNNSPGCLQMTHALGQIFGGVNSKDSFTSAQLGGSGPCAESAISSSLLS